MPEEINNIEIRSEEIDDLLGKAPSSIVRWGITVIFSVISVIFVGSYFYKYPDIINAEIVVQTENVPVSIMAKNSGKLIVLNVTDKQQVSAGFVLGVIENPAKLSDVFFAKNCIAHIDSLFVLGNDSILADTITTLSMTLGDLQPIYSSTQTALKDFVFFYQSDFIHRKIKTVESQKNKYEALYNKYVKQTAIVGEQLKIAKSQFLRDSLLNAKGVLSESDYERSKSTYLQSKYSYESAKSSLDNTQITISQLEQSILELEQQYLDTYKQLHNALSTALNTFKAQEKAWEQMNVLISPIDGKVAFSQFWSINQIVRSGDNVMTIIPLKETKIIGRIKMPMQGAGKVKVGQRVNIKFNNFPYMEYGMVTGKISSISTVPVSNEKETFYIATVELPNRLQTNYKKSLPFSQSMGGVAEVITQDVRLIERFFNPIKAILKKQ